MLTSVESGYEIGNARVPRLYVAYIEHSSLAERPVLHPHPRGPTFQGFPKKLTSPSTSSYRSTSTRSRYNSW